MCMLIQLMCYRSEQTDQLEEAQTQLSEARAEADRMRAERARLADAAAAARHWRDEADAGQEALAHLQESERTCEKLRQRLEAALYYRVGPLCFIRLLQIYGNAVGYLYCSSNRVGS